jgi:hypothetical protein
LKEEQAVMVGLGRYEDDLVDTCSECDFEGASKSDFEEKNPEFDFEGGCSWYPFVERKECTVVANDRQSVSNSKLPLGCLYTKQITSCVSS